LLHASNVSFAYDRSLSGFRLADVSAHVPRAGVFGIIGPNGSGKTTLLKLLAGSLRPTHGRVLLDHQDVAAIPRRQLARRMAVMPQETHAAFDYTALEIVLMGRFPHLGPFELEGPEDVAIAREALAATGTLPLEARQFATLSGGERQRVILASALAQSAELLLLDEPTAALDLGYQIEIAAILTRLNRERGITLVLSTHDLNLAASVCHTLVLLREGRVLAMGKTEEVLTADTIRHLYDVDVDVRYHEGAGHVTVVPTRRLVTSRASQPDGGHRRADG
jgi:iron complex transport system ATP-binding protein